MANSNQDALFRSLRIRPSTDHGVVDVYALDQKLVSFRIVDFPARGSLIGELVSRQQMVEWIWDYGNKRIEGRLKTKGWRSLACLTPR